MTQVFSPDDLVLSARGLRYRGRVMPCRIGRGGCTGDKREGDGATPRGVWRIVDVFYRPDRLPAPCDWASPLRRRDLWSDDPACADYNTLVQSPYPGRHECMWRADPLYDLVLASDWNRDGPVPGRGSAIFLHQWRRPGARTEGCIALSRSDLWWVARRLERGARVFV